MAKCAKGIQNAHFSKGQKLTHSPADVEKRYCNWLKPPHWITTPTLTLYWVVLKIKS